MPKNPPVMPPTIGAHLAASEGTSPSSVGSARVVAVAEDEEVVCLVLFGVPVGWDVMAENERENVVLATLGATVTVPAAEARAVIVS